MQTDSLYANQLDRCSALVAREALFNAWGNYQVASNKLGIASTTLRRIIIRDNRRLEAEMLTNGYGL